jgi:hypothetical protein
VKDQTVIKIVGLANGEPSVFDDQYIVEFDPGRDGTEPGTGRFMRCHLVTTPDIREATVFDAMDAIKLWRSVDPREPTRPDGKPNRPLTAWSVLMKSPGKS